MEKMLFKKEELKFVDNHSNMKVCGGGCNKLKSVSEFGTHLNSKKGIRYNNLCLICDRKKKRKAEADLIKRSPQRKIYKQFQSQISFSMCHKKFLPKVERVFECDYDYFAKHLESKFYDNPITGEKMTLKNRASDGWHIDHIKPCSQFDLTKPEEFAKCYHYSNTQPLWWKDNLTKGCKYYAEEAKL